MALLSSFFDTKFVAEVSCQFDLASRVLVHMFIVLKTEKVTKNALASRM